MLLGELLIQKKLLTKSQLDAALAQQKFTKEFLGFILVKSGIIREEDLLQVLSEQFHMPCIQLKYQPIDWSVAMRFTASLVVDHQCLPIRQDDSGITVAIVNPLDVAALSKVEEQARGTRIRPVLVAMSDMKEALKLYQDQMAAKIKRLLE